MAFPYSSGDVLTAADLNASSGLVHVKTVTIGSGVSSVTVTDAFSSTFDNYRVVYAGVDCSVGDAFLEMQFGGTTTAYYGCLVAARWSSGAQTVNGRNNASSAYVGVTSQSSDTEGSFDVTSPFAVGRTHLFGLGYGYTSAFYFSMRNNNFTSHTAFTLFPASGTLTGGTIRVYGYNNGA